MKHCEHYLVRTTFIDYNGSDSTGTKTYTPVRQEICRHPNKNRRLGQMIEERLPVTVVPVSAC